MRPLDDPMTEEPYRSCRPEIHNPSYRTGRPSGLPP
jgi:hypothetical protein